MMDAEFDRVMTLQEMVVFEMARHLWCLNNIAEIVQQYCPVFNELADTLPSIEDIVKMVQASVFRVYPRLPVTLVNDIFHAIKSIGQEIHAWKRLPTISGKKHFNNISYLDFHWSPNRTNDRMKTACLSKKFTLYGDTMCQCCLQNYIKDLWYNTSCEMQHFYNNYFRSYKYHALAFEKFYLEHFFEINVLQQYFDPEDTPLENIFYLSVYFVYDIAVISYWSQLSLPSQQKCVNKAVDIFFEGCCSNDVSERKTSTFSFLWNKLDEGKRSEIMENKFYHVLRLLLPWPMTEYLISALDSRETVDYSHPIYFLLLWETAKKIPRGFHNNDKYRNLFMVLCSRALRVLKTYRIQHLILTLLEYPEDLDMALNIMTFYSRRRKRSIATNLFSCPSLPIKNCLIRAFMNNVHFWPYHR